MRYSLLVALVVVFATPALSVAANKQPGVPSVNLPAPAAEQQWKADQHREQVDGIAVSSDGKYVIIDANLKTKLATHAGTDLRAYVDVDNDATTGVTDDSKTRHGYEYVLSVEACIDDFRGGATCSGDEPKAKGYHGLAEVARYKKGNASRDTEDVRAFYNAVQTPSSGAVVEGRIAYADLNVKSGQTIRLSICTASVFNDFNFFPDVLLKLK